MQSESVVFLHGLGGNTLSMSRLASHFEKIGFRVLNVGYPSRRQSLEALAETINPEISAFIEGGSGLVHFVGHSMGGRLIREYVHAHPLGERQGRIVMLGTPNRGNSIVDRLRNTGLFRAVAGPAALELATDTARKPLPVGVDIGVIAGHLPGSEFWPGGAHDGLVSVRHATPVATPHSLITAPVHHLGLTFSKEVIAQTENFVRTGHF